MMRADVDSYAEAMDMVARLRSGPAAATRDATRVAPDAIAICDRRADGRREMSWVIYIGRTNRAARL